MNTKIHTEIRHGRKLYLAGSTQNGPMIIWPMYPRTGNEISHMMECLQEVLPGQEYLLVAFEVEDWNRDLSPWPAAAAFDSEDFAGGGVGTRDWILGDLLPFLEASCGKERKKILMGYSLAGLFAMWMVYESPAFDGIISASGSLWFDGWDRYVSEHRIAGPCSVYLSLGGREEKTKNQRMARVGDRTREQERLLQEDPNVKCAALEWNPGGHFADAEKRLAKGLVYLLNNHF